MGAEGRGLSAVALKKDATEDLVTLQGMEASGTDVKREDNVLEPPSSLERKARKGQYTRTTNDEPVRQWTTRRESTTVAQEENSRRMHNCGAFLYGNSKHERSKERKQERKNE